MLKDMPRVPRSSKASTNQSNVRSDVADDMQSEMVVCPWNEFWQHYSPWIPSYDVVQQGVSTLQACKFLDRNRWAEDMDPNQGPIENTAFQPLEHVSKELGTHVIEHSLLGNDQQ